jgi:hypothetical protein
MVAMEGSAGGGILSLGGDIIAAGTALAGLILIYLGTVVTEYGTYGTEASSSVRWKYLPRAWFALLGMIFSIAASGMAILGKWLGSSCVVGGAAILLSLALLWSVIIAILLAMEIA